MNDFRLMIDCLTSLDTELFRHINEGCVNPLLDCVMPLISDKWTMLWPLIVFGIALLIWGGFKGRVYVLLAILCVAIGDPLILNTVKHAVQRERPYQALENVRRVSWSWQDTAPRVKMVSFGKGSPKSMPSAHVGNNMALVLPLVLVLGWRRWWWLLGWIPIMMFSRVYTGDHFPFDTLVGFLLSGAYTLLICCIVNRVWQKYGWRWAPKLYGKHSTLFKTRRTG
jgi:undecaprenyl-diphosphatase